ncbi:PLP-dependent aminotransferase family protein [Candidatus Poriferisodalis sp.]|uniref:aminotransferase-like domain-containing protein n=1 Tax=Candidatus Poriferisodalis sp. TaxID=3101277 RepID=UPI003B52F8D5
MTETARPNSDAPAGAFDIAAKMVDGLPQPAGAWTPIPRFSFVGGNNDSPSVPVGGLTEAAMAALTKHGAELATYNLGGNPQGFAGLREFVAESLAANAHMPTSSEQVLVVSGSLQALDLVNTAFLRPGDVVIAEEATYGGMISKVARRGARCIGVELDDDGIVPEHLERLLDELAGAGTPPRFIYTIPTVQNPTGSVMPIGRRREILAIARHFGVPIFEDECYSDLQWTGERPPTLRALDCADSEGQSVVIYCGSFSKSIAPALRVGYIVADVPVVRQLMALKDDAGTGALEQLVLAEYAAAHFDDHVSQLRETLREKCAAMRHAVNTHMGALSRVAIKLGGPVQVSDPKGGIFVWLTFPPGTDTARYLAPAAERGIQFNEGAAWSVDPEWGARRMRLCFGSLSHQDISDGVAALAEVIAAN